MSVQVGIQNWGWTRLVGTYNAAGTPKVIVNHLQEGRLLVKSIRKLHA